MIPEFMHNRDAIQGSLFRAGLGIELFHAHGHRVDRNRDKIVQRFLAHKKEPDWLLMLDSDMIHPVDCGLRLLGHRVPIVGGLYFHRGTHEPLVFRQSKEPFVDEYGRENLAWEFMQDEVYNFLAGANLPNIDKAYSLAAPGNPLLECDAIGTGCLLIHRSVLLDMEPPWFEYRTGARSEDIDFCYRVKKELDIPIYADMSTICGHLAYVPMGQAQFRIKYRGRGVIATNYSEDTAVMWLERFARMRGADERMANYTPRQLAKLWEAAQEAGLSDLVFYTQKEVGEIYLMDLLWWNASPLFANFRNTLMDATNRKVLVIGSGIGTVAMQLAAQGCDVTAIEPNKTLREFARSRWEWTKKNKLSTATGKLAFRARFARGRPRNYLFDMAVAIDVLEHMEEDVLHSTMSLLGNNVRMGGTVFLHNNWEQQDLYPMHHDYSEIWPSLVADYGFIQTGELWLTRTANPSIKDG